MKLLKIGVLLLVGASLIGCSEKAVFSISDAEQAGFQKGQQKLFQMIGAIDGWGGKWNGEKVELYQFESVDSVNKSALQASAQAGNISGWAELCQVKNMLMLSSGTEACERLESLAK